MANSAIAQYIVDHIDALYHRDFLVEIFTHPDRTTTETDESGRVIIRARLDADGRPTTVLDLYPGKLVVLGDRPTFFSVVVADRIAGTHDYALTVTPTEIMIPTDAPLCKPSDPVELPSGLLENYTGDHPLPTTIGRLVTNYLLLARPLGSKFPYLNKTTDGTAIGKMVIDKVVQKEVSPDEYRVYEQNLFFLGHSPELVSPNITERALMTTPDLHRIRDEDLALHAKAVRDGDAVELARLEQKWIGIDKAGLKGDPSLMYLRSGKVFNNVRKKLYISFGVVENMGEKGKFSFVSNSLEEGWTQDALPIINSETRYGSYARGIETADGGTVSNDILRVFQNSRVSQQDCGTKHTYDLAIHQGNSFGYIYRNYVDTDGVIKTIMPDTHKSFIGKTIKLRSPLKCEGERDGYCNVCMGKIFENLEQRVLASTVVELGAKFTTSSLKKMHAVGISTTGIANLNQFCI